MHDVFPVYIKAKIQIPTIKTRAISCIYFWHWLLFSVQIYISKNQLSLHIMWVNIIINYITELDFAVWHSLINKFWIKFLHIQLNSHLTMLNVLYFFFCFRGKFGTVYRCREKCTGLTLAAKFVGIARKQERRNVEREVEIMRCLQHPRLIQLYDAFESSNVMCVIQEL